MLLWFFENSLVAAGLALVVWGICRYGRFRPAVEHALWLLVLLKLLTPAWIAWPWSPWHYVASVAPTSAPHVASEMPTVGQTIAQSDVVAQQSAIPHASTKPADELRRATAALPADPMREEHVRPPASLTMPAQTPLSTPVATPRPWPWRAVLASAALGVWGFGAVLLLAVQSVQALRFRRLLAHGVLASGELAEELRRLAHRLGVRPPAARIVPELVSPIVWCLGRPTLLWPGELGQDLDAVARRSLLLHELAHLRRRDHWVAWLEGAGLLAWWWNPLFWYVRRRLRQSAEMACDAWVVWAMPDARRSYAESLVAVVELASLGRAVVPAWGAIGETRNLERRLTMIFQNDVRRDLPWSSLALILLVALVVLPGWSWGGENTDKPPTVTGFPGAAPNSPPEPIREAPPEPVAVPGDSTQPTASAVLPPPIAPSSTQINANPPSSPMMSSSLQQPTPPPASRPRRTVAPRAGDDPYSARPALPSAAAVVGSSQAAELSIRVFPLKRRTPEELLPMIQALWGMTANSSLLVVAFAPGGETMMYSPAVGAGLAVGPMSAGRGGGLVGGASPAVAAGPFPPTLGVVPIMNAPGMPGMAAQTVAASSPRLAADSRTQSLIARGTPEQIERVNQLVAALDAPPQELSKQFEKLGKVSALTPQHRSVGEIVAILQGLGIPVRVLPMVAPGQKADAAKPEGALIALGPEKEVAEVQQLIQSLDVERKKDEPPSGASFAPAHSSEAATSIKK